MKKNKKPKESINDNFFVIDFFELMFLAESVIPPRPIARSMCFEDFSEKHYHKMSGPQRIQFFNHVRNCYGFNISNEECAHFYARFDPENQYIASYTFNEKSDTVECYFFDGQYRISKNKFIDSAYITKIVRASTLEVIKE